MHKYKIIVQYYQAKTDTFSNDYEYYIETDSTIKDGDCIAILEEGFNDIRCVLVIKAYKLRKVNTAVRKKILVGIVKTTFFYDRIVKQKKQKLLEALEQRAAQASKIRLYETLATSDPVIATLLKELKEIDNGI